MHQPPDYARRRIVIVALGALSLFAAGREAPVLGSISISVDERLATHVQADWAPPLDLAIAGVGRATAALATLLSR